MLNPSHCPKYWWRNLLNINNLWAEGEMCAAWTWYLADDFQFFLYSPIFLVVFTYSPPMSWVKILNITASEFFLWTIILPLGMHDQSNIANIELNCFL